VQSLDLVEERRELLRSAAEDSGLMPTFDDDAAGANADALPARNTTRHAATFIMNWRGYYLSRSNAVECMHHGSLKLQNVDLRSTYVALPVELLLGTT